MKRQITFVVCLVLVLAGLGSAPTISAVSPAPSLVKLVAEDCPNGLTTWSTDGSWSEVAGITDIAVIPGGLAFVGEFRCGGVNGSQIYRFGLWDGTSVTFPADQPTQVEYAVEYFDGYIWVGRYGKYPVTSSTRPAVGFKQTSVFSSNELYRDYVVREFVSDRKIMLARTARIHNAGTGGDFTRTYNSGSIEGVGLKPGNWALPDASEDLFSSNLGVGWISSCIGDWCYQVNPGNRSKMVTLVTDGASTAQNETAADIKWPNDLFGFGKVSSSPTGWCSSRVLRGAECGFISGLQFTFDSEYWNGSFWVSQASGNASNSARGNRVYEGTTLALVRGFVSDFEPLDNLMYAAGRVDNVASAGGNTGPWRSSDGYLYLARWLKEGTTTGWRPGQITAVTKVGADLVVACSSPEWFGGQTLTEHKFEVVREHGPASYVTSETDNCEGSIPETTLSGGKALRLRVSAVDVSSQSTWSLPWDIEATSAPDAPASITNQDLDRGLSVSWLAPAIVSKPDVTNYEVAVVSEAGALIANALSTSSPVQFSGLSNGTNYIVKARACSAVGCGPFMSTLGTPAAVPSAPRSVASVAGDASITTTWVAPLQSNGAAITGYKARLDSGSWTEISSTPLSWTVAASNNSPHTVSIRAINRMGSSEVSTSSAVTPLWVAPSAPRNLALNPSPGAAILSWNEPASGGSRVRSGYRAYLSAPGVAEYPVEIDSSVTSRTITGLSNGLTYNVRFVAVTTGGEGASANGTVSPRGLQTITFPSISNRALTASPFVPTVSSSAGLPVSLMSSTTSICSVAGTSGTLLRAGTCTLNANQAGNSTYLPASQATQSFLVTSVLLSNKKIIVRTPGGTVVTGAALTWVAGSYRSTSAKNTDSSGSTTWSTIPAGPVTFTVTPTTISKSGPYRLTSAWTGEVSLSGTGTSDVVVTAPIAPTIYTIGARTFADLLITNVTVQLNNATCANGIWTSVTCESTKVANYYSRALTNTAGNATIPAYCTLSGSQCGATLSFVDGDLTASITRNYLTCGVGEEACVDGAGNWLVRFADVPYVVLSEVGSERPYNQSLTIIARALAGADSPLAGKTITLSTPTSGATGRGCAAVLSAVTDVSGYATFTFCPIKTAYWLADGAGLVASAPLLVDVRLTPGAPTGLAASSLTARIVNLSWSAPSSIGASSITDYIIQYRQIGSASWLTFADGRSTRTTAAVTTLVSSVSYEFKVAAVNSSGTSSFTASVTTTAR